MSQGKEDQDRLAGRRTLCLDDNIHLDFGQPLYSLNGDPSPVFNERDHVPI